MRQNGVRAKLRVRKIVIDSSVQAQSTGDFMSQNWRSYSLSDNNLEKPLLSEKSLGKGGNEADLDQ